MAIKKLKLIPNPLQAPEWLSELDSPVIVYQESTKEIWSNPKFEAVFGKVDLSRFLKNQTLHLLQDRPVSIEVLTQPARYEEYVIENRKGKRFIVNLRVSIVGTGPEAKTLAFIDDVTEKAEAAKKAAEQHLNAVEDRNEQIRILQKEKLEQIGRYAGGIMHNLSQPLQTIKGNTEELIHAENLSGHGKDFVEEIQKATNYLADIVKSFKTFVRAGDDDVKPFSTSESIRQAVFFTKNTLLHQNIDLDISLNETLVPQVSGRQGQLVQVLVNLITNAKEAIEEAKRSRGKITITQEVNAEGVRIKIRDNGCGMDEITQRKIFDPFFTTKAFGRGTGLGLSTSLGYLREMNAQISVKSEPGTGSEFSLFFPNQPSKGEKHGH